jgi:hypothetical protein
VTYLFVYLSGLFIAYFLGLKDVAYVKKEVPASEILEDWVIALIGAVLWPIILIGRIMKRLNII